MCNVSPDHMPSLKDEQRKSVMFSQKCVGIVLRRSVQSESGEGEDSWMLENGFLIFQDFQEENRQCFWNSTLIESVNNVEFMGFIAPGMLLIGGNEFYLEGLRSSWARRVLKPPANYVITRLGDMSGLEIQVIGQTQFTPLPEALCLVVSELNGRRETASLQIICQQLQDRFSDMIVPNEDIVYSTLGKLIKERKIYHTGDGYFVVTPKTYRLTTTSPPPERPMLMTNEEAMLKLHGNDLQSPKNATLRSRSIQANMEDAISKDVHCSEPGEHSTTSSLLRMERFGSMRLSRREKSKSVDTVTLRRGSKSLVRDINFKDSPVHHDVDKGEKVSMFQKLFRRSSSKRRKGSRSPVQLATFSAQFPPTEWTNPSCIHYQSRATQTLENRTPKDKISSTNSLKPKADSLKQIGERHRQHHSRPTNNADKSCDDSTLPRNLTKSSSLTRRSSARLDGVTKKAINSSQQYQSTPRRHRRAESCTQVSSKDSEKISKTKMGSLTGQEEAKLNNEEEQKSKSEAFNPPQHKVAPYNLAAKAKESPMNNAGIPTAIACPILPTTIVNKLSPNEELSKTKSERRLSTPPPTSPSSASEFDVAFSSLAAQKILKGLSITSIDTLMEVNLAADAKISNAGTSNQSMQKLSRSNFEMLNKKSQQPFDLKTLNNSDDLQHKMEDGKNEAKLLGIV